MNSASIGRVEARNVVTGELVWSRPMLEGLTGSYQGKDNTMTGKTNETWAGDMYKTGGGATWLGGTYDPETKLVFLRHRQPGAVESLAASRRQQVDRFPHRHRSGKRRAEVGLPDHPA